jgi:hypothetical protein
MSPLNYEVSAPAQHAATTILRNFDLRSLGDIEPTAQNIATIVDVATQVFRIQKAVDHLVRVSPWWNAHALEDGLEQLQDAVRAVEMVREGMPRFRSANAPAEIKDYTTYVTSAPALHAAKTLIQNFLFYPRASVQATEKNLAILVDVCTDVFRVEMAVDYVIKSLPWSSRGELRCNLDVLRKAMRAVEVVQNRMPNRAETIRIPVRQKEELEIKLTKAQLQQTQALAARVAAARTVDEQQRLLQQAGVVHFQT